MTYGKEKHLIVDYSKCDGHGICAEMCPEWIHLDQFGFPILRAGSIPKEVIKHAEKAVLECPKLAIKLIALS